MSRKKMSTKRRMMLMLMAVILLMATSMTALAANEAYRVGTVVTGRLNKVSTTKVEATTTLTDKYMDPPMYTYVKLKVKYSTISGSTSWSTETSDYAPRYSATSRTVNGSVVGAESAHGVRPTEIAFNLWI